MRITKRKIFYLILLIAIGFFAFKIALPMYQQKQQEKDEVKSAPQIQQERIVPVETKKVQRGEIKSFLTVSGLIEPRETIKVYPKTVGQVKQLLVKEGDAVQKGDILMRLDDEQIRLQVAQTRATLDSAQASLEKIRAGARPQEVSQAEAALQQAKIGRDSAEENYLRMEKLFSGGAVSEQQFEQAKNQYEIAQAQFQSANESYKLVTEGAAEQDIKAVEAQARQAQSTLEIAQSQLNNTIVRAPISGSITSVNAKTGEMISSTIPLLVIIDTSELYVNTGISEKDVASVQVGQEAEIFIDAFPENVFLGEVSTKGIMVDPSTKTMEIKIKILNSDIDIPPGVFARADISIRKNTDTLIIPDTALTRKKDGIYVFVLEGDTVRQAPVVTGIRQGNQVEILEGLQENENIVTSGNLTLQDGDKVRVISREGNN